MNEHAQSCIKCGSTDTVVGEIGASNHIERVIFRPADASRGFLGMRKSVNVFARACCQCGHIEPVINPEELKGIRKSGGSA